MDVQKDFLESLIEAEKKWGVAEQLLNVTYRFTKDPKLLLRCLENLNASTKKTISLILKFEYLYKKIALTSDPEENLKTFFEKLSHKYQMTKEDISNLKKIIELGKKHKESSFEFSKKGKVIILDDNLGISQLTTDILSELIITSQKLIKNTHKKFREM